MWEAIDILGARRIGHGVRCTSDTALLNRLRTERIALEMCPTSNVQTGAVRNLPGHPAIPLLAAGLPVTISTDTRTTSDTTLQRESDALRHLSGWTSEYEALAQQNAAQASFSPQSE